MQTDATAGSHAVVQPVYDILQASGAFDEITYAKGASVIRMLETYTGETAWRDGVARNSQCCCPKPMPRRRNS